MLSFGLSGNSLSINNAKSWLDKSIKGWFVIALCGQWAFALYVLALYAIPLLASYDISDITPTQGYEKSVGLDAAMFFGHIIPAVWLSFFGMSQLIPKVRQKFSRWHRWNGRIFFLLGVSGALTGLYLQWVTGLRLSDIGSVGITLNGILIVGAIGMAWFHAVNKRIDKHMRWAIHAFLLVNGVWLFRLSLMAWYIVNQGPNGNTKTLDGPADIFISFACYLIPMMFAELYLWAKKQRNPQTVASSALAIGVAAAVTLIGVVSAIMMMWLPRITGTLALLG